MNVETQFFKTERKEKPKKRERADSYPSLRTSSRAFVTRFDEIDRSNERQGQLHAGLVVVPRDNEKKKKKKKKERKKEKTIRCFSTPKAKVVDKKNVVSQGVLRRCSTRKRCDTRTQVYSLAHFAAARCGLSLFTSWYARLFLATHTFFFLLIPHVWNLKNFTVSCIM